MKQHLLKTLLFILVGLLSIPLFNYMIDPLDIYRFVRRPGLNEMKPHLDTYSRLAKPLWLRARPYERLALGSSRTEIGIPVSDLGWGSYSGPGMNGAVSGARLTDVAEIFHHATLSAPLQTVVIGVDFFMFNAHTLGPYASPGVLAQYNSDLAILINQATATLFSASITGSSLYTVTRQRPKYDKYRASGQMNSERETSKSIKAGYPKRFERFADSFMENVWSPCKSNAYTYKQGRFDSMALLADIVERAAKHTIEVKLFVPPVHARLLEAMAAAGHWSQYEQWKQDMVTVIAAARRLHPQADIELWDFSGYNAYTMEEFPATGHRMQWYIDSTHFSEELGQLMLNRMYGDDSLDFGVLLTEESVEEILARIRDEQHLYRQCHPDIFKEMWQRFQKIRLDKKKSGKNC